MVDEGRIPEAACCGCGEVFPAREGPTHRYMLSSPGCWAAYGEVLAREYEHREYRVLHRLSVDAYAVQHPGVDGQQSRNSVGIHLSRLCLLVDRGWPMERANNAMLAITGKKKEYPWLTPPAGRGIFTVKDVLLASTAEQHLAAVERWAKGAWEAWSEYHGTVRRWLDGVQ